MSTREHREGRTVVRCELRERRAAARVEPLDLVVFARHGPPASRSLGTHVVRPSEFFAGVVATLSADARGRLARWLSPDPETGDHRFDDAVLISTAQPQTTLSFLARADVREAVLALVEQGSLHLEGRVVTADLAGRVTDDPPALRRLVAAYAEFARG
ncbi:MAG: hypothetical protein ACOZQL_13460 [Myxococcota bacterium]